MQLTVVLVLVLLLRLAVAVGLGGGRDAHAGDPSLVFRTLETTHFSIHYPEPLGDVGRRVALCAERAHALLAPALGHSPRERTQIVITDDIDGANGFASVVPRNQIHLYASAPSSVSTLNDHDDWLFALVTHEYAHVLHLDTIGGLPSWYNRVFGKTWAPNQIQPRWFIEGLATYEESLRTSGGRVRSAIFRMFLRAAALAEKPLRLDELTNGALAWPHGNAAYLYGSHFLQFIAERHGDDALRRISHEFGRQPFPYGINRAVRRATGSDYPTLYAAWLAELSRSARSERDEVVARGLLEGTRLTDTGESNGTPRFFPDGSRLAWSRSDGHSRPQLRALPAAGDATESTELALIDGQGAYSFLPDGSGFVFERRQPWRTEYDFGDLWRYEFAGEELTRLTHGLRAADPDVSPDGKRVAFTINGGGRRRLALLPLDQPGAVARIVWEGASRWDQVYSPVWSPDGGSLVFTGWSDGGHRDLWRYDLSRHEVSRLTNDRAIDLDPRFTPDGRFILFASDRSGIYNLYALPASGGALRQVTNVVTGAFAPTPSPDGKTLVYVGFEADGYELFRMPLDETRFVDPAPLAPARPEPVRISDDELPPTPPRPYRAVETLGPRRYELGWGTDSERGPLVTATTFGSDVVGWHSWSLGASVFVDDGAVDFGASYGYGRLWSPLRLAAGRRLSHPGGRILDSRNTRYPEEVWSATAALGFPIVRVPGLSADLSLSYDLDWLRDLSSAAPLDPNMALPRPPETGLVAGVAAGLALSTTKRFVYSLGPAEGRSLFLAIRFDHPALGGDFHRKELSYRWQEYLTPPWQRDHVLALRVAGAISDTDRRRDGLHSLGGLPRQDLVDAVLDSTRVGTNYLRGYAPGVVRGRQVHLVNAEYRMPALVIDRGLETLPIHLRRLHLAGLVDWGHAFDGAIDPSAWKLAVGASLRLDVLLGWFAPGTFDLGWARGLSDGGFDQYWLLLTGTL